ncbi:nuclear transport factor 2 family protein [Oceanibium sediminis]|uniref:nuclear transport factor 2 family protein n=1 Tax=Oceanibium sediminis TaxID=2026339 RepID=UPI000DD2F6B8|nr:nuclear transport factor 2 family protein [Oceanibium sediminis]
MGFARRDPCALADVDCLQRLLTAYSRAVDRRDFALLRRLYDDEAEECHGEMFTGGPDAYVAFVRDALSRYDATVHYVVQTQFALDGDRAEGEVHKLNWHRHHDGRIVLTSSRSLDHYLRRDGTWRFYRRTTVLDWARHLQADPGAEVDFAAGSPPGQAGPGDPSFGVLPLLAAMK